MAKIERKFCLYIYICCIIQNAYVKYSKIERKINDPKTNIVINSKCLKFPNWQKQPIQIFFCPNSIAIMLQFKIMIFK